MLSPNYRITTHTVKFVGGKYKLNLKNDFNLIYYNNLVSASSSLNRTRNDQFWFMFFTLKMPLNELFYSNETRMTGEVVLTSSLMTPFTFSVVEWLE